MSDMAVENVGIDVAIKCGDSRSNGFRDIRGADFVSNERTNIAEAYLNSTKCLWRFPLKKTRETCEVEPNMLIVMQMMVLTCTGKGYQECSDILNRTVLLAYF